MSGRRVSAIVLAGGRSSRFGRDKLAEPVHGRTLLEHAIEAVRGVASEIIVVAAPDGTPDVPSGVRVARDAEPFEGPLAGLWAGLGAAREAVAIVTAGDMPELQPGVVDALLRAIDVRGVEAAVLEDAGRSRPLPMAIERHPAMRETARLLATGERRLRALVDALATTVIAEASWRAKDPDGRSLRDVDTPDDLR
jgi:molybdopterin-guanine dinucleotide biosynthesis protein A